MIGLWIILIFLFVFSILPKFPQWNQKTKYVSCRTEMSSFFSCRGPHFCPFDGLPGQRQCGWGCWHLHCFPFLSWAEEVVVKKDQERVWGLRLASNQCQIPVDYCSRLPTAGRMFKRGALLLNASRSTWLTLSPEPRMPSTGHWVLSASQRLPWPSTILNQGS